MARSAGLWGHHDRMDQIQSHVQDDRSGQGRQYHRSMVIKSALCDRFCRSPGTPDHSRAAIGLRRARRPLYLHRLRARLRPKQRPQMDQRCLRLRPRAGPRPLFAYRRRDARLARHRNQSDELLGIRHGPAAGQRSLRQFQEIPVVDDRRIRQDDRGVQVRSGRRQKIAGRDSRGTAIKNPAASP